MFGPQLINFTLTAAVATPQYRFVLGSGANYGGPAVLPSQFNVGISQNSAAAGEGISVCPLGISRCYVDSAVAAYDRIVSTAGGGAAPVSVVSGANAVTNGYALTAGAIGDIIPVFVQPPTTIGAV
jgi:hypothetical protein